ATFRSPFVNVTFPVSVASPARTSTSSRSACTARVPSIWSTVGGSPDASDSGGAKAGRAAGSGRKRRDMGLSNLPLREDIRERRQFADEPGGALRWGRGGGGRREELDEGRGGAAGEGGERRAF